MPKQAAKGRKSRKNRRQWWIVVVSVATLISGLLLGNALDAYLLASEAQRTTSFEEGWKPFQAHLSQLSSRSAWLGLLFLVIAGFALPRAQRVVKRYFSTVRGFEAKRALLSLAVLFVLGGVLGYFGGSVVDRSMSAMDIAGPTH